jgi:hypothetical protein
MRRLLNRSALANQAGFRAVRRAVAWLAIDAHDYVINGNMIGGSALVA